MKVVLRWRTALVMLFLLLVVGQPVLAQGGDGGRVVFGRDFTLPQGQTLGGDLVVFGGSIVLEPASTVRGNVMALGGSLEIMGCVDGDVFAIGGDIRLRESALVLGDVVASGQVVRETGAIVRGRVMDSVERDVGAPSARRWARPGFVWFPGWPLGWPWGNVGEALAHLLRFAFGTLAIVAIGVLLVLLIPGPTRVVGNALVACPGQSIGLGLLTALVAILVTPVLVVTCIGIPVALFLLLALAVTALYGWVAAGLVLGERLLPVLGTRDRQPMVAVALGLALLAVLSEAPCLIGLLVTVLVGTWGIGGAVLTRLGSTPHTATPAGSPPLPPAPHLGAEPPAPS